MRRALLMAAAWMALGAGEANAGEPQHKLAACKPDVERLCKDVPHGRGRVARCLHQHEAHVSAACKQAVTEVKAAREAFRQACAPDAARLCQDTGRGPGRILGCLESHRSELGEACRKKVDELPGKRARR